MREAFGSGREALRVVPASKGAAVGADRPLTADDIPREVLEAAVEQEVEDRALAKLDAVQEEAKVKEQARIRKVLDALVDKAHDTEEASAVEVLLWNEFDETWQIKEDTVGGHLSKEDAMADWEALRAETDAAVREIVPDAVAEDLWRSMSGEVTGAVLRLGWWPTPLVETPAAERFFKGRAALSHRTGYPRRLTRSDDVPCPATVSSMPMPWPLCVSSRRALSIWSSPIPPTSPSRSTVPWARRPAKNLASSNQWFEIFPNARFAELFAEVYRVLKKDRHFYMFCDAETMFVAKPIAEAAGFKFWKPIVWDKVAIGMGYHYRARHEFILFFEKGKRKLNDLGVPDILTAKRVYRGYPTEKPVEVSEILVTQSTQPGELVCDPFCGSGSAGVAVVQQGRDFLGNDTCLEAREVTERRLLEAGASTDDTLGAGGQLGLAELDVGPAAWSAPGTGRALWPVGLAEGIAGDPIGVDFADLTHPARPQVEHVPVADLLRLETQVLGPGCVGCQVAGGAVDGHDHAGTRKQS